MTRRFVRLTLFVGLLLALGAATYQIALLERALASEQARREASARAAAVALEALLEVRGSERAYLAEGQGAPYWHARLDGALGRLTRGVDALRAVVTTSGSHALLDTTDETLARLLKLEARIAEHALAGRRPHAEDLIFADALEASGSVERDVRAAAPVLDAESQQRMRDLRERELIIAALAASIAALVALLLVPVRTRVEATANVGTMSSVPDDRDLPLNLRDTTPRPAPPASPAVALSSVATPTSAPKPARDAAREIERAGAAAARLTAAADLCGALARVQESRELPALLAHINRVLDAQATIVWVASEHDRLLRPALAHGYRDEALARLGPVAWDAPNPAAEAFRRREARVIDASGGLPGALVVPLVSAAGCAGVVTAELKSGTAPDPATVALARIFAAQLGAFVAPAATADALADGPTEVSRTATSPVG